MRVFHVITHFDVGGAERVAVNIAKSKTQGIEYHLVEVVRGEGEFSDAFIKELGESHIHYHRSCIKNNKVGIIYIFGIEMETGCDTYAYGNSRSRDISMA